MDSAGLHALLGLARTRGSRSLAVLDPPAWIMRSFEIAGIDQHPAIEIRHADAPSVREQDERPPPIAPSGLNTANGVPASTKAPGLGARTRRVATKCAHDTKEEPRTRLSAR